MKLYSIEVDTDLGRRVVKLANPLDIDPRGDMPLPYRALTEVLWGVLQQVAIQAPAFVKTAKKVEA